MVSTMAWTELWRRLAMLRNRTPMGAPQLLNLMQENSKNNWIRSWPYCRYSEKASLSRIKIAIINQEIQNFELPLGGPVCLWPGHRDLSGVLLLRDLVASRPGP